MATKEQLQQQIDDLQGRLAEAYEERDQAWKDEAIAEQQRFEEGRRVDRLIEERNWLRGLVDKLVSPDNEEDMPS